MRLVVVDRDALAGRLLALAARRRGHRSLQVRDWSELGDALPFEPSALVLGADLLDAESIEPLLTLGRRYPRAVTVVAAERVREPLPLYALRAGVGDVVRKPYNPFELVGRIERLAQAAGAETTAEVQRAGDVEVDLARYSATKGGTDLRLTRLELRLLYCLIEHAGRVTPTEKLVAFAWEGSERADASLLKTHVSHLRAKLRAAGGAARVEITSRHSLGYTLTVRD